MAHKLTISPSDDGRRLDRVIRSLWPGLPLSVLMKGIRTGSVRLDAKKAAPQVRVTAGQELYVPWDEPKKEKGQYRYRRTLPLILRDRRLWAVDKPENLLVQPDKKDQDNVLDRVKFMLACEGLEERAYAVHRLDRNTTGLLLVALSGVTLRILQDAFRERSVDKTYLALVSGRAEKEGEITAPLLKDPASNTVRVDPKGKEALTRYRLLAGDDELSLVEIDLVTGRSHQARVHMASIGRPVVGDQRYGDEGVNGYWWKRGIRRPLLHSHKIKFNKLDGELADLSNLTITAPLAKDMEGLISSRGWRGLKK